MTFKSSFVSSWGYYTECMVCFEVLVRLHTNTYTFALSDWADVLMQKQKPMAGEDFICVFLAWRPCELLNWAGPFDPRFGAHIENLLPVQHFTTHTHTYTHGHEQALLHSGNSYMKKWQMFLSFSLLLFFLHAPAAEADGTLHGVPQFISSCFEQWSLNMFVSFTDKTEDFSSMFSLLKCIIQLFCCTLHTHDEGEWSNYIIIYATVSTGVDWQMVGGVNNKFN